MDDAGSSSSPARGQTQRRGERGASVLAEALAAPARGPAENWAALTVSRAQHHWPTKAFARVLPRCPSRMFKPSALPLADRSSRDSTGRLALGALKAFMSLIEAPARVPERNRNLRIIPTTCAPADGRAFISPSSSSGQSLLHATIFSDSKTVHQTSVRMQFMRTLIADRCIRQRRPNRRAPVANRALGKRPG
jgi:hypothetical protein